LLAVRASQRDSRSHGFSAFLAYPYRLRTRFQEKGVQKKKSESDRTNYTISFPARQAFFRKKQKIQPNGCTARERLA
jgi:hypothetical protein